MSQENDGSSLLLDFHWEMRADSDHYPFFEKHLPVLMLHTGLHSDYHRPSDTADKINAAGMREVAQLMFRTALDLAETDSIGGFRERSHEENAATQADVERPLPPLPGRFGVSWDDAATNERGLKVRRSCRIRLPRRPAYGSATGSLISRDTTSPAARIPLARDGGRESSGICRRAAGRRATARTHRPTFRRSDSHWHFLVGRRRRAAIGHRPCGSSRIPRPIARALKWTIASTKSAARIFRPPTNSTIC